MDQSLEDDKAGLEKHNSKPSAVVTRVEKMLKDLSDKVADMSNEVTQKMDELSTRVDSLEKELLKK